MKKLKIGYIGLGKMGRNMVLRMQEKGHSVVAFNRNLEGRKDARKAGVKKVVDSLSELVKNLPAPRLVWIMVSHKGVDEVLDKLLPLLSKGDTIIDGGNCFFEETVHRAKKVTKSGFRFLDVGVSGGPSGARSGACLMIGGEKKDFIRLKNLFADLSVPDGFGYMGGHGAGHFVKMVHNGIEYGMMQALSEGFAIMKKSPLKPDLTEVARLYNKGSVVESRLVGWLESAFKKFGVELDDVSGAVAHTGEGEWTVKSAKALGIPAPIIEGSFQFRVASATAPSYTGKVLSALRNQFGGHDFKKFRTHLKINRKKSKK